MRTKLLLTSVVVLVLSFGFTAVAQSQNESLGDYARAVKKTKPASTQATKVFDNDNLPGDASVSVVGSPAPADSDATKDQSASTSPASTTADAKDADAKNADAKDADAKKAEPKSDKKDEPQLKPGQPMAERDAALDALKKRLDEKKKKVDMLAQDLDLTQREYNLKSASFYSDPNRLTNPNSYYQDLDKFKQQVAEKQKALDDAKAELAGMQDQARRQGAPDSMLEQ